MKPPVVLISHITEVPKVDVLTIHRGKVSRKEEPPTNAALMWEKQTSEERRDDGKLLRRPKLRPGTSATLKLMGGSLVRQGSLGEEQERSLGGSLDLHSK